MVSIVNFYSIVSAILLNCIKFARKPIRIAAHIHFARTEIFFFSFFVGVQKNEHHFTVSQKCHSYRCELRKYEYLRYKKKLCGEFCFFPPFIPVPICHALCVWVCLCVRNATMNFHNSQRARCQTTRKYKMSQSRWQTEVGWCSFVSRFIVSLYFCLSSLNIIEKKKKEVHRSTRVWWEKENSDDDNKNKRRKKKRNKNSIQMEINTKKKKKTSDNRLLRIIHIYLFSKLRSPHAMIHVWIVWRSELAG